MSKSYPINCVSKQKKLAKIGFDDYGKPVIWLWCKEHRIEHICTLVSMQRSWRGMLANDRAALVAFRDVLNDVVRSIEVDLKVDLEDVQEQSGEATG
jgi:hypothetical protein